MEIVNITHLLFTGLEEVSKYEYLKISLNISTFSMNWRLKKFNISFTIETIFKKYINRLKHIFPLNPMFPLDVYP